MVKYSYSHAAAVGKIAGEEGDGAQRQGRQAVHKVAVLQGNNHASAGLHAIQMGSHG